MKKTLIALAITGTLGGLANAQSNVVISSRKTAPIPEWDRMWITVSGSGDRKIWGAA